jgi:hypothetical protein
MMYCTMKQTLYSIGVIYTLTLLFSFIPGTTVAQTPGFIFRAATSGGAKILDPNGDGYVSLSKTGFQGTNDVGTVSEIPYRALPILETETIGDVNTSSTGGHTDLVPPSPVQAYFDGTHFLIRMRLGSQSTASKGYSLLIDSNNSFTGTGVNPGFEYEVLLASNFDVRVINHGAAGSPVIFSGSELQYSQRAIAATTNSGNADYFYDFYVPLSAFNGGITAITPLRVAGITITSAQSGITGNVSDVNGVNFQAYGFDPQAAWRDVINSFPPLSLNDLRNGTLPSVCPRINTPLYTGAATISGTTSETSGTTTLRAYRGNTLIGTTTVTNTSNFTINVSPALAAGSAITVTAQATGKTESSRTCNTATVLTDCNRPTAPTLSISSSRNSAVITASATYPSVTFRLYQVTSTATAYTPTLYREVTGTNTSTGTILPTTGNNDKLPDGEFFATIVVNGCESGRSNYICNRSTQTVAPTITSTLTPSATQISGTAVSGALVILVVNGVQQGSAVTATGGNFTFNLHQPLAPGQQVFVRTFIPNQCSSTSATQTVTVVSTAPTLTGTYCGPANIVSGTSTEPTGTTIQVYSNGIAVSPTTTVNQYGYWTVTLAAPIPIGNTITARASNLPGRTLSPASQPVTVAQQTANTGLTINPITEESTTITGKAPAGALVTLYIEGTAFTPVTTNASGNWTVTGISPLEVFAGASVTATVKVANQCESARITPVIVTCLAPSTTPTIAPTATTICSGNTAQVTIGNSENGISYRLLNGATETGSSVLGTGGTIVLESGALTTATTLRVRARKISGTTCDIVLPGQVQVTINPLPPSNYTVTINNTSGCAGTSPVITVAGTQTGYSYQLINDATKQTVTTTDSNLKPGTGGAITFTVASVGATTTYGIRVTNTTQATSCSVQNQNKVTYNVTGPASNQPVSINRSVICPGGSAVISVTTNNDNFTYQLARASDNANVGSSFTGTGQVQTITVSPTTTTTYFVRATGGGCTTPLQNRVTLEVSTTGVTVTAGENRTVCDNSVTLTGTNPAPSTGTWTITSKPASNTTATISNPTNFTTTATGLTSGTYVFTWTINTSCAGSTSKASANVTIIVNCPATYSIAPPRYLNQYSVNSLLASATDQDGGIGSATFASGSGVFPHGAELLANGDIRVSSVTALKQGTYTFDVITRDLQGIETRHTLTIRIYGSEPTVVPLPVELVYFRAALKNNTAVLEWLTASEINNERFEVQRSTDEVAFEQIAIVDGSGNSSIPIKYTYTDTSPVAGITYYRLKQVDFDGKFDFSKVVFVRNEVTARGKNLLVYPNPFAADINITLLATESGEAIIKIIDLQGKIHHTDNLQLDSGTNQFKMLLQFLSKGIYIIRIDGNGFSESVKILKQ